MSEPEIVIRIPIRALRGLLAEVHDYVERQAVEAFTEINAEAAPPQEEPPRESRPWTDKQRRFLYRLLQQLGHEGDAAKSYIKTALRLNGEAPTSSEASQLIDQLQGELGRNGKGVSRGAA